MYNCIVFDVDGTIIDTEKAVINSLRKVLLEELAQNYSYESLSFVLGIPGTIALSKLGIKDVDTVNEKWNSYTADFSNEIKVFSGAAELLAQLFHQGITTGIVTSETKEELKFYFEPFGLMKYLKYLVCADDTIKHKPNPDPILKFIEVSGADPSKTLYVGDTFYDMECAKAAGIEFALALWGAKNPENIQANYRLSEPKEILSIL